MIENINEICNRFSLGELINIPIPVTGGLLHKIWKVETVTGSYAVKVLNREIMSRPEALNNYYFSEKVAQIAADSNITAVPAININGNVIEKVGSYYVMVYKWYQGTKLAGDTILEINARKMGRVLGSIHKLDIKKKFVNVHLNSPTLNTEVFSVDYWNKIIDQVNKNQCIWIKNLDEITEIIFDYCGKYLDSMNKLSIELVISHRDLDPKNVIWVDDTPMIIDWESAGLINPYMELITLAFDWSRQAGHNVRKDLFTNVFEGYKEVNHYVLDNIYECLYGILANLIEWLEYNIRRAVNECDFEEDEQNLANIEVIKTIDIILEFSLNFNSYASLIKSIV